MRIFDRVQTSLYNGYFENYSDNRFMFCGYGGSRQLRTDRTACFIPRRSNWSTSFSQGSGFSVGFAHGLMVSLHQSFFHGPPNGSRNENQPASAT